MSAKKNGSSSRIWSTVSYASKHRHELPGKIPTYHTTAPNVRMNFTIGHDPLVRLQLGHGSISPAKSTASDMIMRQKPHPVLKPSPALAMGADRAAYIAQMRNAHRAARGDLERGAKSIPANLSAENEMRRVLKGMSRKEYIHAQKKSRVKSKAIKGG